VVGIKPTVGLWSRSGIIPISITQDTAGPMARTVRDAAILLTALVGKDENDSTTMTIDGKFQNDYTVFLDRNGLTGKRLGVEKSYLKRVPAVDELYRQNLEMLRSAGAELVEVDFLEQMRGIGKDEFTVLLYEFKDGLTKYLSGAAGGKVKTLEELIAYNKEHAGVMMPIFTQDILERSQQTDGLQSKTYKEALKNILKTSQNAINGIMDKFSLDAIIGPSYGPAWCTDHINGDYSTGYGFSGPAAMAGYPHITVPMGFVSGLPIGLSFFGRAFSEASLLTIAYSFEQNSGARRMPQFEKPV
jgi:amidase